MSTDSKHPAVKIFTHKLIHLLAKITAQTDFTKVHNFYAEHEWKKENLWRYFFEMFLVKPKALFVGEAPGIHGCYLTGIPFTSERILRQGINGKSVLHHTYRIDGNKAERSATIIWKEVMKLRQGSVLFWNVFPLHPYEIKENTIKNRRPTKLEKEWGIVFLAEIIDLFPNIPVYSLGNLARESLQELNIPIQGHLRHPRNAHHFRADFAQIFTV